MNRFVYLFKNQASCQYLLLIALLGWVMTAQAVRYGASLNHAEWNLELSPFECRMWQPIPTFGTATFSNRAGEEQKFYLEPIRSAMKAGKATLVSKAPIWNESMPNLDMGTVMIAKGTKPLTLGKKRAYQLLNELYAGMSPEFSRHSWYLQSERVDVFLSSVNFRKAYGQYKDCLAGLLPVNFDQINRSRVHFLSAKYELTSRSKFRLDQVVQYVKADPSIIGFYIDGHTDSVGRRLYNLELSKQRAQAVTKYLVANGVDEAMITTRYHGERYPLAKNTSAKSRASNRRVTIRLERDGV
jgi:outer membrane protein OmpA-like peptidoglycan-associated protein